MPNLKLEISFEGIRKDSTEEWIATLPNPPYPANLHGRGRTIGEAADRVLENFLTLGLIEERKREEN